MIFRLSAQAILLCLGAILTAGFLLSPKSVYSQDQIDDTARDTSYVRALNEQAADLINEGHTDSARVMIDEALNVSRIIDDENGEAYAFSNLGNLYLARGLYDSTITRLLEPYERLSHTPRGLYLGNVLATGYLQNDDYTNALELYTEMYNRAVEVENFHMQAATLQNLGITYSAAGDKPMAVEHYMQSLELAEERSDSTTMAVLLNNLGTLNVELENYELAEEYIKEALKIGESLSNLNYVSNSHSSLGILYNSIGRYEKALSHYQTVLDYAEQRGDVYAPVQTKFNIGNVYNSMENYQQAIEYFQESLRLSREYNILPGSYYNNIGLGLAYFEQGDYDRAVEHSRSALDIAEQLSSVDLIRSSLQNLIESLESAGDTTTAYPYLKRYSEITDSLSRTEREEALARQETVLGLRTERENRQLLEQSLQDQKTITQITYASLFIIILALGALLYLYSKQKKANNLLKEKTAELIEVNDVKDQLLSVLSHDLRTPLASLKGVVFLIREGIFEEKDTSAALNEIDYQLQQGINTLSNYLQWAQNQKGGITANNEEISLKPFVDDAAGEIEKSAVNKDVLVDNRVQNHTTVIADEQLLRVILRNLLSNAIKYVNGGDKIIIDLIEHEDTAELMIKDTGMGIPEDEKDDLFKPFTKIKQGTRGEKGTGLGLSITKDFCEKMGGSIRFESRKGEGTTFFISLNKPDSATN